MQNACYRVEWDYSYWGGDYSSVGRFTYIPVEVYERFHHDMQKAFNHVTGENPLHIIHWSEDEFFTRDGQRLDDI